MFNGLYYYPNGLAL